MQDSVLFFMVFAFGLGVGGSMGWCLTWLYGKSQRAELEAKRDAETEKIEWIKNAQQNLREAFEALASKSLRENGREVLTRINQNLNTHAQHIDGLKGALEKNINQNLNTHAQHIDGLKGALEKNINQNLNTHAQHIGVLKGSLEKNLNVNLTSHTQHIDVLKAALEKNVNQNLMSHAQHIGLLKATLEKNISQLDGEIRVMEQKREGAYQSLKQQIIQLERAHSFLHQTTQQPLAAKVRTGPR